MGRKGWSEGGVGDGGWGGDGKRGWRGGCMLMRRSDRLTPQTVANHVLTNRGNTLLDVQKKSANSESKPSSLAFVIRFSIPISGNSSPISRPG